MCRRLIYLVSFILVMIAVPLVTHAQVDNLVQNPSFEEDELILDDPDWVKWCTWNPAEGAGSNATVVDTEFIDGTRSLRVEPKGAENWHFIVLYLSFPADIDKNYTASFWAKAEAPRPLTVQMKAADNSVDAWGATDFELTTDWTEYTYTSEVLHADVKLEILCAGVEVPFWLDLVFVYEGEYVPPPVTITVEAGGDIAAANAIAEAGDTIEIAEGTYVITEAIEMKDGVTYRGAGPGLTIIDGSDATRAFVAWGDRSFNEDNENPNDSGPKGWVLEGMTIQNCVADTHDRFSFTSAAFNLKTNFATLDANASGGLDPDEADGQVGCIRLEGADLTEGTEDDDLHRFAHIDTDGSGELSEAELDAQILVQEDEFGDEAGDGGAIFIGNQAVGTIQNCDFLNNHTPIPGDGDDGGAVNITGLSTVIINDCLFDGNYACSPTGVSESDETGDADGDGSHIKVQGGSASAITPGTTLIATRCVFLNGRAEDDGGAIQSSAVGSIIRLDACWFEGNTAADDGTVLFIGNESSHELTVTNCVFANNISSPNSDRMCQVRRNSNFINCTFVGNNQDDQDLIYNNADSADTDADGTDDEMADATQVVNCIFANNVVGNGDHVLGSRNDDFTIAATNCLFFGNTLQNGNAADNTQRPDVETGSVLTDPLLDADYVPGAGSEAIDGGVDPATVGVTLTTDYNGNERPQGAAYDIGAYEVGATAPSTEGLVAYYALENNTEDGSGNGNDGTIVGAPTFVDGPAGYGTAMEFHGLAGVYGGGDYIDCGNDASLDITGPISIALWIRPGADDPEGNGTETAPMAKAMSGMSPSWSWQVRYGWGSTQPYMAFTFNSSPRAWAYVGRNLERDEWCHIACSHDGTTLKCYLNGEQTDSTPMTDITSSSTPVLIGSDGWGCDWIGAIDEVAIYNRALSEGAIMYLAGLRAPPVITVNPIETMEATGDFGDILSINGIPVGDLIVGTTMFPDPPASEPQPAENADNFSLDMAACADNQPYMQTMFGQAVTTIFIFEKSGNDNGSMQALDAMGDPVGNAVVFSSADFAGTGYTGYGDQVAFGTVITSDIPIYGVILTASRLPEEGGLGIDPFCISAIPEP